MYLNCSIGVYNMDLDRIYKSFTSYKFGIESDKGGCLVRTQ